MQRATFQDLVHLLTDNQTPRVWSLLVTVFGELAQDKHARISGALLSKLNSLMGIKPEAMRVALHRLRKDGWIESERNGRTSAYALTTWGRSQSAQATPRIYDLKPVSDQAYLALFDPNDPAPEPGLDGVWVASNLLITAKPTTDSKAFISSLQPDQPLPDWMTQKICNADLMMLTQDFYDRLGQLKQAMQNADPLSDFETAALRILIVDSWRRIVLRTPQLPAWVFPAAWVGNPCRESVAALLSTYKKQNLNDLMQAL